MTFLVNYNKLIIYHKHLIRYHVYFESLFIFYISLIISSFCLNDGAWKKLLPSDCNIDSTKNNLNESNRPPLTDLEPLPIQRIIIDSKDKLIAYDAFQHVSSNLIMDSIQINNLIKELNIKLLVVKGRKLILDRKCLVLG